MPFRGLLPLSRPTQIDEPTAHIVEMRMTITCPCQPDRPLLIRSIHERAVCDVCQRTFVIGMMRFDRRQGDQGITAAIGTAQPTIVRPA